MAQISEIYQCETCGIIIEVLHAGESELACCGQSMKLMIEKTKKDEGNEKHVPVKEVTEENTMVKVGSIPHPMEEEHSIEWIELENKDKKKICRKTLKPGEEPEAKFCAKTENSKAKCYCNVHGLWKGE